MVVGSGSEQIGYCSSCTPGDPTDVLCEDSDGAETVETGATDWTTAQCSDATYVQTISTGAYFYENAHSGTLSCSGKGSYAIEYYVIDASDDGSENAFMMVDITEISNGYVNFYFNIVSESLANLENIMLFKFCSDNTCAGRLSYLQVLDDAGNLKLRTSHRIAAGTHTYTTGSTVLSTGTWYRVSYKWESGSAMSVLLNGGAEISSADVYSYNIYAIQFGSQDLGTATNNHAVTIQMDLLGMDDDTMPGACP